MDMEKDPQKVIRFSIRELLSMAYRLGEKIRDKYIWTHLEIEEAIGYLIYFRNHLKTEDTEKYHQIFGENGEFFEIRHFKKGFNSKLITFKTIVGQDVKKWVLKVGHRISIVVDFGDPSTLSYYEEQKKHLQLLKEKVTQEKNLQYLIPSPHEVVWAVLKQEGNQTGRTLIVQPFLHVVKPKKVRKKINDEQRELLLKEFKAFKKVCKTLLEDYQIEPDLLGEGNLEVVEIDGGYHLMLLDSGFVNLHSPLPITHTVMHFASLQTLNNIENLIKKIL